MPVPWYDWIAHHAMRRPDAVAAHDLATGRRLTYRAFDRRVAALAGHLRHRRGVVPRPGAALTEEAVLAHCAAALGRYKIPRSVSFAEALPRTASGKMHKPTLRRERGGVGH